MLSSSFSYLSRGRNFTLKHFRVSMSSISAALVKELREKSGAPMMECKKALAAAEVQGDLSKALDWLRAKGKARAASGANRTASEGLVSLLTNETTGTVTLVEINSETDFVSRNKDFQAFVWQITSAVQNQFPEGEVSISSLLGKCRHEATGTVQDALADVINVIRENIVIRRASNFNPGPNGLLSGYVHGKVGMNLLPANVQMGSSAGLVRIDTDAPVDTASAGSVVDAGRKLAMHVVAASPAYLDRNLIPQEIVDRETQICIEQAETEADGKGKPKSPEMLGKVVAGKVNKRLAELTLTGQAHMAEPGSPIVAKHVAALSTRIGVGARVYGFTRWALGQPTSGNL